MITNQMQKFIDLKILPSPDFNQNQLMALLFKRFHYRLATLATNDVAVAFPRYAVSSHSVGNVLRIIGDAKQLELVMAIDWMYGVRDQLEIGAITSVPDNALHRMMLRIQPDANPDRLRRRQMARHKLTLAQSQAKILDKDAQRCTLPFLNLRSDTSKKAFRLYLKMTETSTVPTAGSFNAYGISRTATIPWF